MDFAVIKTGGKQYLVKKGDVLDVEKLGKKEKEVIEFKEVLMMADDKEVTMGTPFVTDKKVLAEVVKEYKDKKVTGAKHKAKKRYNRKFGHRQNYTQIKITEV